MLYIVATPIGNLEDMTYRAVRILKDVDMIACEDTRTSKVLFHHYDITTPLTSFHAHSSEAKIEALLREIEQGKDLALVSDAGTPGISDPGYAIIQKAIQKGIEVVPIPGPSAVITALSASGMSSHHFLYLGFLPVKKGRKTLFEKLQDKDHTVVIYESVHRIIRTLGDLENYFGADHHIVIGRELTKKFETFYRGSISEVRENFEKNSSQVKGEFVVLF
ncbi:16S rRNA (cytidine(1402)-2'-O)-methyltransferase [Candidatus Gracilibacteria bacterium]|nr:16S rRNA (cytidine(1402)-2'-O)-methyltransferase [Candidatus Gracilibacteria bacterium]